MGAGRRQRRRRGRRGRGAARAPASSRATCCSRSTARRFARRATSLARMHAAERRRHAVVRDLPGRPRRCRSRSSLQPMPPLQSGLYYSLALVGILSIVVGASVRLRRPNDPATLHFFWLTVAFFGVLAFTPTGALRSRSTTSSTGRTRWRGSRCRRCSCTSRSCFPIGRIRGCEDASRPRSLLALLYLPAAAARRRRASRSSPAACTAQESRALLERHRPARLSSIWRSACSAVWR